jgi:hypothetical protein
MSTKDVAPCSAATVWELDDPEQGTVEIDLHGTCALVDEVEALREVISMACTHMGEWLAGDDAPSQWEVIEVYADLRAAIDEKGGG